MKFDKMFPGTWLKAADLDDEDHTVTIESVKDQMVGQGEQAKLKLVIKFEEFDKPLVCNLTNAKAIAKLHGDYTEDWIGKRVVLWVNPDVSFGVETVAAIRVRSKAPASANGNGNGKSASAAPMTFKEAIALCATVGITQEDLVSNLKAEGRTGWNGERDSVLVRKWVDSFSPPADEPHDACEELPF